MVEKVYSAHKLETFQVLGPIIRVHWNHEEYNKEEDEISGFVCDEIVVPVSIDTDTLVSELTNYGAPVQDMLLEWRSLSIKD